MRAHLIALTVPMIWGVLAIMSFNLVDTWFVAQLGADRLAAMSFTFPVVMVLVSLGIGLMAGTSSVLARVIGEGDHSRVRRLTTDALVLAFGLSALFTVLGLLTIDPLFRRLGVTEALLPLVREYMTIWYAGFFCFLVPMVGLGAIRATGDAKFQSRTMMAAALVNLVLDPLLIFGLLGFPRLELAGAALATVLSRGLTLLVGYWALRRMDLLSFEWVRLRTRLDSWRSVLHVGLPAAGTNMIIPLSSAVVVALLAELGPSAVAGFGAATRVEAVSLVVFFAMSAIIGPFMWQNLGAGRHDRILEAIRECARFCLALGVVLALGLGLGSHALIRLFSEEPRVVEVGRAYLLIVPLSYGAAGLVMVVNAGFNGLGRPLPAVLVSSLRVLILYLPAAFVGAHFFGAPGIFVAASACNLLAGGLGYLWLRHRCRVASQFGPEPRPVPDTPS